MRIDIRPRQSGKTTSLILESLIKDVPIICYTIMEAERVWRVAQKMGYNIPRPIAASQARTKLVGRYAASRGCLVDNADLVLEQLLGSPVISATFTSEGQEEATK